MSKSEGGTHRAARLAAFTVGGLLFGAIVGATVVIARDGGRDAPDSSEADSTMGGVVTEGVPLDQIEVGDRDSWTTAQHGDDVIIVDGLATDGAHPADPGADPHLRVWTLSASDPSTATRIDFPDSGPMGFVAAWAWDDQWGISGYECPTPWRGDRDDNAAADCGSTDIDVVAVDPATATARVLSTDLEATYPGGGREHLRVAAVNGATTLLQWAPDDQFTLDLDGRLTDIGDLGPRYAAIIPSGESFAALVRTGRGHTFGLDNTPHPVGDFLTFHRLVDTTWVEESLPPLPTDVTSADAGAWGDELVAGYRDLANEPGQSRLVIGDGTLAWQALPPTTISPVASPLLLHDTSTFTTDCVVTNPGAREDALAHSDGTIAHDPSEHRCHLLIVPLTPD